MKRLTLELETVTPLFLRGGGDEAEWRGASVRGQLRWWFRAVAGGALGGRLDAVRDLEEQVFGSTARSSAVAVVALGNPSVVSAGTNRRLGSPLDAEQLTRQWGITETADGRKNPVFVDAARRLKVVRNGKEISTYPAEYLAYGCTRQGQLERGFIAPGEVVSLRIQYRESRWSQLNTTARDLFLTALWSWLHLGGIGAKSRNGFGSLRCACAQGETDSERRLAAPRSRDELALRTQELLQGVAKKPDGGVAQWSHFSDRSRVFIGAGCGSWPEALTRVGGWLVAFRRRYGSPMDSRSWGGQPVANRDYVWAAPAAPPSTRRQDIPDRAGFGLPLPFGKPPEGEIVSWKPKNDPAGKEQRRASPLLIHVEQVGPLFYPILTHLPSLFLPKGGDLLYQCGKGAKKSPGSRQTEIIQHFLDDLASKNLIEEVRP